MKHLNIDRQSQFLAEAQQKQDELQQQEENSHALSLHLPEKKKKFGDQFLQEAAAPPPNFDEKKKTREKMFDHFEESTIEETRLVNLCEFRP